MSTPDAPWRVYMDEWLIVWTGDAPGPEGQAECLSHFQVKYQGRVRERDWRVVPGIRGVELARAPYCLQLRLPNLRGEYKDQDCALAQVASVSCPGRNAEVVRRGSAQERELLDYGRKMLPAVAVKGGKGVVGAAGS